MIAASHQKPTLLFAGLLAIQLAVATGAWAQDSAAVKARAVNISIDSPSGTIHISAGRLSYSNEAYVASEPVEVRSDSFHIEASSMRMHSLGESQYELQIFGEPVEFEYFKGRGGKPMHLFSPRVVYRSDTEKITFYNGIQMFSDSGNLSADRAVFNLATQRLELLESTSPAN